MTREIPLTQGKAAIVDDSDYEYLSQFKWCFAWGYAVRHYTENGIAKRVYMHNEILKPAPGLLCDHINRNSLDNRRSNLREATRNQNAINKVFRRKSKAGYRGVWFVLDGHFRHSGKYSAAICVNGKRVSLGASFKTAEDAARAYDEAAKKYHGEFAILNFA